MGTCVCTCVCVGVSMLLVGARLGPQDRGARASHPLVVDSEVVVQVDDALRLAQEAAVGGLCPPVQHVARAVVLAPWGQRPVTD